MMKAFALILTAGFLFSACSGADSDSSDESLGSAEQAVVNGWIGPVSDEGSNQNKRCSDDSPAPGMGATAAFCAGRYCDDMYLFCGTLPQGFSTNGEDRGWTAPYISEESGANGIICPGQDSVVDGIRATGSFSDNISVHCTGATFPSQGVNCGWSPYFSEEQGQQNFVRSTLFGAVARGVRCSGRYCDAMSYFICEPKCTSNAHCQSGAFCNSAGNCQTNI
jgi:hypothetical protein